MARETDQEQWDRKNKGKTDYVRARQLRLGHVSAPEEESEEEVEEEVKEEKVASRSKAKAGSSKKSE